MTREERFFEASRLRGQGLLQRQIAERMGISRQWVAELLADPHGNANRRRRVRYGRRCEVCGKRTDGSNGRALAPRFCAKHAPNERRVWTRAAVIAAIRRWANEHGKPPSANDWNRKGKGHPPKSCVYKNSGNRTAPFASWADAIEAAGFTRPRPGWYERKKAA